MKSLLVLLLCLWLGGSASAQSAQPGTWIPNDRVNHMTRGDGKIFLSGYFNWIGEYYANNGPVLNTDLSHDASFPIIPFSIEKAIPDGAGGWFTCSYSTLGHLKADKTFEILPVTLNTTGAPVYAMGLIGNTLYIGGQFNSVNGTPRANLAAIDVTNNTLTSWNPVSNGTVYTMAIFGTTVYVGGSFSVVGGLTRYRIAAVDATTGVTSSWNANVISSFGYVLDIIPTASAIYFGGNFTNVGGGSPTRRNFAAVNATTGALTTFNPRPDGIVYDLCLDGTTLYIAGGYLQIAAVSRYGLAALDTSTGSLTSFNVTFPDTYNGPVSTMAINGQKLFLGGDFNQINGVDKAKLAVVDKTTGALDPTVLVRNLSDQVRAICIVGTKVLVGSYYLRGITGDYNSKQIFALNESTGQGVNWTPQSPGPPAGWFIRDTHLQYQNNRLYYSQNLEDPTNVVNQSTVGALNPSDGSVVSSFNVSVIGVVDAWAFSSSTMFLAGDFTSINGTPRAGFAAVDLNTGALLPLIIPFAPDYSQGQSINSLAVYNNVLYASGFFEFTPDQGETRTNLAAWNSTTGDLTPWAPQVPIPMYTQVRIGAAHNGRIYLIGGVALRVNAISGEEDSWTPDYYDNSSAGYGGVNSLVIQGNSAYLAGDFSPGLMRVGIVSGDRTVWEPTIDDVYDSEGNVTTLEVSGTKLFVGGNFSFPRADGQQQYYAQFDLPAEVPNDPPQIAASTTAFPTDGIISIDLTQLISDPDDNLDLTTLSLLSETSEQGAAATLDAAYTLTLDYGGPFSGTDHISIEVCDLLEACTEQEVAIEVGGTGLMIYNAVSPNGDGKNDEFILQNIPTNNQVTILNRWGTVVFEIANYDNQSRVFRGFNSSGSELPSGTYYYRIDFEDGQTTRTGYISLRR